MSKHHDIGSRYEEPDTTDDDTAKCCKCSNHFNVEMMETKDCIKFICPECKRDADEAAGDAKRAEQKDENPVH